MTLLFPATEGTHPPRNTDSKSPDPDPDSWQEVWEGAGGKVVTGSDTTEKGLCACVCVSPSANSHSPRLYSLLNLFSPLVKKQNPLLSELCNGGGAVGRLILLPLKYLTRPRSELKIHRTLHTFFF